MYREPQIQDQEAYKGEELDATTPFGEVFQAEKQFEEDVFEPECPYGEEEKTFMQQHPLFGDFGVKAVRNLWQLRCSREAGAAARGFRPPKF